MKTEMTITVSLPGVWRKAEVDFQTFQLAHGEEATFPDLTEALALEPDFFSSEWCLRSAELIATFDNVVSINVSRDIFSIDLVVDGELPAGCEAMINALAEAYFVRTLLGAWNELRHTGMKYDWRGGASEILIYIGELSKGRAETGCLRRPITGFP